MEKALLMSPMAMALLMAAASKDLPAGTEEAIDRIVEDPDLAESKKLLRVVHPPRPAFVVTVDPNGKPSHPKQIRKTRHKKRFRKRK